MRNTIHLFVKDAKCQEMLIEVLAGLVAAHWKVGGDEHNSVTDKTTEVYRYICTDMCTDMCTDIIRRHLWRTRLPRSALSLSLSLSLPLSLPLPLSHPPSLTLSLVLCQSFERALTMYIVFITGINSIESAFYRTCILLRI